MEFANLTFLYLFLPAAVLVYYLLPGIGRKNTALLVFSLLFYAMGQPLYLPLLVLLSYANFRLGLRTESGKKGVLIGALVLNIGVLAVFKYLDFFLSIFGITAGEGGVLVNLLGTWTEALNKLGFSFTKPTTALPIGLSFYTFQVISYFLDLYRGKCASETQFRKYLLYLTLFPKMTQGPITRYAGIQRSLRERKVNYALTYRGAQRFAVGLAKKVLLADYAGRVISDLAVSRSDGNLVGAWFSAVLFFYQIYFDFSGDTDMAIGLGMVFGLRLPENFDLPYTSTSITEFWRRWHMTLGAFFRDYVYIPLGGNRKGLARQIGNMLVVWLLTGLWHGAGWTFLLWGLYFFLLLAIEKTFQNALDRWPVLLRRFVTTLLVLLGWVIFSHTTLSGLGTALGAMIGLHGTWAPGLGTRLLNSLPLLLVCAVGATSIPQRIAVGFRNVTAGRGRNRNAVTVGRVAYLIVSFAFLVALLWLCTVSLVGASSAPSIYANF